MRKIKIFSAALCSVCSLVLSAQNTTSYTEYFNEVLANNTSLRADRLSTDAAALSNMTGLNLANPEVSFAYQWGPLDKIILDVSQTFDFATLSGNKKAVAVQSGKVAELEYAMGVRDVLSQTDKTLVQLAYYNSVLRLYDERLKRMESLKELSAEMKDLGEITIVDYSMLCLSLEQFRMEADLQRVEYETLENELTRLNGGKAINTSAISYDSFVLPSDFNAWYDQVSTNELTLRLAEARVALGQRSLKLSKSGGLPDFSVGYTSEMVKDDNHFGVSLGFSLPLWGNRNSVKAAKAELAAAENAFDDSQFQLHADMKSKFDRAASLYKAMENYRAILNQADLPALVEQSYVARKINTSDYLCQLNEIAAYQHTLLDMERDYQLALCELKAFILY